jgi:hypothetical protein
MADGARPPRPKSSGSGAGPARRPKRPDAAGKRPPAPGKPGRRPAPAGGRAKLAPFNPKSKPVGPKPRPAEEAATPPEPMLLQIQFKPSQKPAPLQPEKLKWESRPRTPQPETAAPARPSPDPEAKAPPKKDYRHGRLDRPRPSADRPAARSGGDRPAGRPSGDRQDRPSRPSSDRPYSKPPDRPGKPAFDRRDGKPSDRAPKSAGDRPYPRPSGDRSSGRPSSDRPSRDRPSTDRPTGDRPYSKSSPDRSSRHPADRPYNRPAPGRPAGRSPDRPEGRPTDSDRPAHRPSADRPARPSGDRPYRPSSDRPARTGDRPDYRSASDRPARPSSDRPPYRSASDRPPRRADEVVDPKTGKKFDEKRPRDTRIGQGNKAEPKRRLTADESFDLPKPWVIEIQELARPGTGPKVAEAISKALEHFADEEYEDAARLAGEAKESASRSPRVIELLGLALYHSGQWKEALSELLTFRRLTASVEHNHVIADLYRALERPDRALETTAEVTQADVTPETWVETMIVAAGALADKGDLNRAITMLARADPGSGAVEPYFLRHWYARADLLERAGRKDEARNLWRKIVATDPDFFDAEERLGAL